MSLTAKKTGTLQGTASTPTDSNTVLLMHCDGTNGGTSFTDSSNYNQTITNAGSVITSTTAKQFGTSSFYTNRSVGNYYLSVTSTALMFGTSNFTIEFWMKPTNPTLQQRLMGNCPNLTYNSGAWGTGFNTGGLFLFAINNVGQLTATNAQTAGNWYHIAVVRNGTTWSLYQNGVLEASLTSSASFDNGGAARPVYIGWSGYSTTNPVEYYDGYLDEIRFTNGRALYTSNFSVPTSPFSTLISLYLPGSSGSYMALGTSHPSNFDTSSTNFFVEAWVLLNALPAATKVYYIVLRGTGVYGAEDIGLRILPSGFAEFYSYGAGNTIAIPNTGTALSLNTWYHLAGSIDSLTKTVYIFLNGVLKNSASMAGAPRTTAGSNFFIGTPTIQTDWVAANCYIQDMRVVRGGSVPKLSFTPEPSTFGYFNLLAPPYVPGGTCVLCLLPQYFPNTLTNITPSGRAGGYGANVTGGDLTQIIAGNKVHFFTTVGTQTITVTGYGYVTVLIVAGGGGGGYDRASGGGAGGLIYTQMILQPGTYAVTVGDGGAGSTSYAVPASGSNSSIGSLVAIGGGGGACGGSTNAVSGGSGGGAQAQNGTQLPGAGIIGQGNAGGYGAVSGTSWNSGGGGGAGGIGFSATSTNGGNGGPGRAFSISGTLTYYGGGGGGSRSFDGGVATTSGLGGIGGGGNAGQTAGSNGSAGTPNTGGGGGGGGNIPPGSGGKGGSGIVIISYPTAIPVQITGNSFLSQLPSSATVTAAFSLRALNGSTAKVVNVRRSSDSTTQDFWADRIGNLTTLAYGGQTLASWLGTATGYVTTWYDQTTSGYNATQATASAQPQIKIGTKFTKYSLVYTGAQVMNAFTYNVLTGSKYTVCMAERRTIISGTGNNGNNTSDNPLWSCGLSSGAVNAYPHYTWRNTNTLFYGQYGNDLGGITSSSFLASGTEPIRYHFSMVSSTSGVKNYIYNDPLSSPILAQNAALTGLPNMSSGPFSIGFNNFYPGQGTAGVANGMFYIGEMYEVIVFKNSLYDVDGTTTIGTIYTNQSTFYI